MPVVCTHIPRFDLLVALGGRAALAQGPVALAGTGEREQRIGTVSASAEAFRIKSGMRLGEALARCPQLQLATPDPVGVEARWEGCVRALEALGAAVEVDSARPGIAYFELDALRRLHRGLDGVLDATRAALDGLAPRIGVAASRFGAFAAAAAVTPRTTRRGRRHSEIVDGGARVLRAYLAPLPVGLLAVREPLAHLPGMLERLGVRTLGELAQLLRAALADRFGDAGVQARELACGRDEPLRPRTPTEQLEERLELPEAGSGAQLQNALGLLIDRLLARRERRGRTLRAVVLEARLVEGGTWRTRLTFRAPLADAQRMRLALAGRLAELPAPADVLALRAEGLAAGGGDQVSLLDEPAAQRATRLREAVRQVRAAAGPDAALRVLEVDPDSRVPERRLVLTPWES